MPESLLGGKVVAQREMTDVLRVLLVEVPERLEFTAGQFTKIGLPVEGDRPLMRAYSFVNSPDEAPCEFFYDVLTSGGNLTPRLGELKEGDDILVSARPSGMLTVDSLPDGDTLFLVATGTGVGPFISIMKTEEPWRRFGKVVLVYSVRERRDMAYLDQVESFRKARGDRFAFAPIVTRESVDGMLGRRMTACFADGSIQDIAQAQVDAGSQFMLCGNPEMVKDMSELLEGRGLSRNRVRKPGNYTLEKYW